jgi:hypothetical protein
MLRESRKGSPTGECLSLPLNVEPKLGKKRDKMEIVKAVHDSALVLVLIAIVLVPRAIDTYLAGRK